MRENRGWRGVLRDAGITVSMLLCATFLCFLFQRMDMSEAYASMIFVLAVMVVGALQLRSDWAQYEQMSNYVSRLNQNNAKLERTYRDGYDLEDIRDKALALGMVPVEEVPSRTITVTRSQPKPERTLWDDIVWFFGGLFGDGESASFG